MMRLPWFALLVACTGGEVIEVQQARDDCVDNSICAAGEACLSGTCEAVECLTSTSCGLGSFCDVISYTCLPGCQSKDDCPSHQECSTGTCTDLVCRETHIDCAVGEVCDETSQTCELETGLCSPCEDNSACGEGRCARFRADEDLYCYDACETDADCAAGFDCLAFNFRVGNETVTESICFASCPWLVEVGWL